MRKQSVKGKDYIGRKQAMAISVPSPSDIGRPKPVVSPVSSQVATPASQKQLSTGSTPESHGGIHGRAWGHPRKALISPTYDDLPQNASKEEILKWKKCKNTAAWWYANLTSDCADVLGK